MHATEASDWINDTKGKFLYDIATKHYTNISIGKNKDRFLTYVVKIANEVWPICKESLKNHDTDWITLGVALLCKAVEMFNCDIFILRKELYENDVLFPVEINYIIHNLVSYHQNFTSNTLYDGEITKREDKEIERLTLASHCVQTVKMAEIVCNIPYILEKSDKYQKRMFNFYFKMANACKFSDVDLQSKVFNALKMAREAGVEPT